MSGRHAPDARWQEGFKKHLVERFVIRFHMTLILGATTLSGVVLSKLLFLLGVESLPWRYPLAVAGSYLVFFGAVRLWLSYVLSEMPPHLRGVRRGSSGDGDTAEVVEAGADVVE